MPPSLRTFSALGLLGAIVAIAGACARDSAPGADPNGAPAGCQQAIVNPVSGFAECVRPRGAPVAPAPPRPDALSS